MAIVELEELGEGPAVFPPQRLLEYTCKEKDLSKKKSLHFIH